MVPLGGDDRDGIARHHIEQAHGGDQEKHRGAEPLQGDEFHQRADEGQQGQCVIEDLAMAGAGRLDGFDEQQQ